MTGPGLSRRAFLLAAGASLLGRGDPALAGDAPRSIEDWSAAKPGAKGVPPGWQTYETPGGHPAYDFTMVEDAGRRALDMKSAGDHSTIAKEIQADLTATPILAWQWRVIALPSGANLENRATSDATGHVFVIWPRFPALVRSRLIGYVWDPARPVGTVVRSRKTSTVSFIVVRRGESDLGQWLDERRHVADDHLEVFGERATTLPVVALSIDTNDTRSSAEALFGRIDLQPRDRSSR
ncbi:MAG TPA: DUF3047 domain-containing protein [Methylomirabilota bacterium]|jgi:hypothetical protein